MPTTLEHWKLRRNLKLAAIVLVLSAALARCIYAGQHGGLDNLIWLRGLSLEVFLPALLALAALGSGKYSSAEGGLMRVGCALHFLLIIYLAPFALYLALGLPFVFLVVELLTYYAPAGFHHSLQARLFLKNYL